MKTKKIVILVLASSNPHYKSLENTIKETWFNLKNDDVDIIFYSDNQSEEERLTYPVLKGDNLILPCDDGYYFSGVKTVLAYDWLLKNYDFEYVYRSNLGAYVSPKKMLKFIEDKPKENFYCGIHGFDTFHLGFSVSFISGSGYFLSKDVVQKVIDNHAIWPHRAVDDVALGWVMEQLNVPINSSATRMNIGDGITDYNIGDKFVDSIPEEEIYHVRLRSENRQLDIDNMILLYKKETEKND